MFDTSEMHLGHFLFLPFNIYFFATFNVLETALLLPGITVLKSRLKVTAKVKQFGNVVNSVL